MQILGLFGMYIDAAVVFVTKSSLLFRFAMAILWYELWQLRNKLQREEFRLPFLK